MSNLVDVTGRPFVSDILVFPQAVAASLTYMRHKCCRFHIFEATRPNFFDSLIILSTVCTSLRLIDSFAQP